VDFLFEVGAFFVSPAGMSHLAQILVLFFFIFAVLILWQQSRLMRRNLEEIHRINEQTVKRLSLVQDLLVKVRQDANKPDANLSFLTKLPGELREITKMMKNFEGEFNRMADSVNQKEQVTRAIEMAQRGMKRTEIVEATGLSAEQADTIVKFHGPDSA